MTPFAEMNRLHLDPGFNKPRYPGYVVVDAHTDKVLSVHKTRREANTRDTEHSHRVRGTRDKKLLNRLGKKAKA